MKFNYSFIFITLSRLLETAMSMTPLNRLCCLALFLAAFFVCAFAGMSTAQDAVGWVQTAKGQAVVISADGKETPAKPDMAIAPSDVVRTGPDGSIQIMFADESMVKLESDSEMAVTDVFWSDADPDQGRMTLGFTRGVFGLITGKLAKTNPDRFKVDTPQGFLGVRGTEFGSIVDPDKETHALFTGGPMTVTVPGDQTPEAAAKQQELCEKASWCHEEYSAIVETFKGRGDIANTNKFKRKLSSVEELMDQYCR